jgi:nucleotide-binding universal stress UspA family protein
MKTILVPTDFSKNSLNALRFAIELAVKNSFNIIVIHQTSILDLAPESTFTGFYVPSPIDQIGFMKTELDKFVNRAINTSSSKINKTSISTEIIPGVGTVEIILETAKKHKADLIILGSTGASGIKRILIGSVAAKVVELSKIPVIIIPEKFRNKPLKHIGYASDLSHVASEMEKLIPLADMLGASIEIFHVEPTFPTSEAYKKFNPESSLIELRMKYKRENITYKLVKTKFDNDFYTGIDKYRRNAKPDLLCMVSHKRNWVNKILDPSKSKGVAYHNEIPVICFKG